ncbi:MAG: quinolinate synthase NadA [Planctomycetes bacterium]|nr:quinolinate synthase NadA [Planctomycetota bacterium]
MHWQQPIPRQYLQMPLADVLANIARRKAQLGHKLVILGHHYQQDEVIQFADFTGDSFQLSRQAARLSEAEYVIFCGVHFMAESADVLTADHQKVILPDMGAGCSMADMAKMEDVEDAWATLREACAGVPEFRLVPITYVNSSAAVKSFVGRHGGAVCTSSNCEKILAWALGGQKPGNTPQTKIIFFPDQHLGRNTAYKMGFPLESMVVWDYRQPAGGLTDQQMRAATLFLWKGHCSVHQLFRPEHVDQVRQRLPGVKVLVHPECNWEVVQKADLVGSTEFIRQQVAAAPPGSKWAIGTEVHMVSRLAKKHPEQTITILSDCQCLCTTMYRIDPPHLLWALDNLAEGKVVNQIQVDPFDAYWSRVSLQRMLDITAGQPVREPPPPMPERVADGPALRVFSHV